VEWDEGHCSITTVPFPGGGVKIQVYDAAKGKKETYTRVFDRAEKING
jgi:hypothetical protein